MTIIGLTGGIGHGKTTFVSDLAACAKSHASYESSGLITEVANSLRAAPCPHPKTSDTAGINEWLRPLPGILAKAVHKQVDISDIELTEARLAEHPEYYTKLYEYLELMSAEPELATIKITPDNKWHFRALLQWLGGYLAIVVDEGVWYDEIIRRIQNAPEVELVVVGGLRYPADATRISRVDGLVVEVKRPGYGHQDAVDLTERERTAIVPDITIMNDSDLSALQICATELYDDLNRGQVKTVYVASKARPSAT